MVSPAQTKEIAYEPVIGLEVHAQLQTESKIFCGCRVSYGEEPNSLTCPVCLGLPGALPILNKQAVEYAMRMILAVGGQVNGHSVFARKNYFYPDLPKGYQISQFDKPIGTGGAIQYRVDKGEPQCCRLIRIHLEEDAGKSIHPESGESRTRVDLNRCGTALIEIVSEPDLLSPQEAYAYLVKLKQILQYLEVCTGDMEKGHLRCDANVSVRPVGQKELGTRTELKNMNSFKGVERALTFEIERQTALLRAGGEIEQTSLMWDEKKQVAEPMRSKEESHDYRYFPEPDLLDLTITSEWIESVRAELPELPEEKAERFLSDYRIREYDAGVLTDSRELADFFEQVVALFDDPRTAANWIQTEYLKTLNELKLSVAEFPVRAVQVAGLLKLVSSGKISGKMAKTVFAEMVSRAMSDQQRDFSPEGVVRDLGLEQVSDESALALIVDKIISENESQVQAYRNGKEKLFGFFVGQVMKETKGQANPEVINRLLKERLGN
ncbi:MAG: Asp-tRNA(Asn)/Glu-tRNA(Gln) amidotransferase subunit GatB [bacterium]|nr:Asp-tRNA(Asn)/Glu-tRNA(Gln) amidotransferase subunit GatB [bacterium]